MDLFLWIFKMSLVIVIGLLGLTACTEEIHYGLTVEAGTIDARKAGDLLIGPSVLNDANRFVWGGSVVKGNDGRFHMLYNSWECGDSIPKFSDSWVLYSKIAYAVSDKPDRDFEFKRIVLEGRIASGDSLAWDAQVVTNAHIRKFGDTYYLYYVGSKDPGIQPSGSPGEKLNTRNRVQQQLRIGVVSFSSFDALMAGNFERSEAPLLAPRTRVKRDYY